MIGSWYFSQWIKGSWKERFHPVSLHLMCCYLLIYSGQTGQTWDLFKLFHLDLSWPSKQSKIIYSIYIHTMCLKYNKGQTCDWIQHLISCLDKCCNLLLNSVFYSPCKVGSSVKHKLWSVMQFNFPKILQVFFKNTSTRAFFIHQQAMLDYCSFWIAASLQIACHSFQLYNTVNGTHQETNHKLTTPVCAAEVLSVMLDAASFSNDWPSDIM